MAEGRRQGGGVAMKGFSIQTLFIDFIGLIKEL